MTSRVAFLRKLSTDMRELCDWYKTYRPQQKTVSITSDQHRQLNAGSFETASNQGFRKLPDGKILFDGFEVVVRPDL